MAPHIYQALPKETWGPDETTPTSESFHSTRFIDRSRLLNYTTRYGFAIYVFSTVLISAISFFAGMRLENLRTDLPKVCWRMHNMYSQFKQLSSWLEYGFSQNVAPAIDEIDLSHHDVRFNGTIDFPSQYRGEPSPALDEAWEKITNGPPLKSIALLFPLMSPVSMARITEEEFKSIPHNPDTIRISDDFGGGYMASPEVYHQLHCLVGSMEMCYVFRINSIKNLLRMGSYWNWDYYRNSSKPNVGRITSRMHYGIHSPTIRF